MNSFFLFHLVIPCPYQSNVLRCLAEHPNCSVTMICQRDQVEWRNTMCGWKAANRGKAALDHLPEDDWRPRVRTRLKLKSNAIHVLADQIIHRKLGHARKTGFEMGLRAAARSDGINTGEIIQLNRAGRIFRASDESSLFEKLIFLRLQSGKLLKSKKSAVGFAPKIYSDSVAGYLRDTGIYVIDKSFQRPSAPWLG